MAANKQMDKQYGGHNPDFRSTNDGKSQRQMQYQQFAFDPSHVVVITVPDVCQMCEQPSVGKFCTGRVPVMYGSKNGSGMSRKGQRDYHARLCQRHADMRVNHKSLQSPPAFNAKRPARLAAQVKAGQTSYLTVKQWMNYTTNPGRHLTMQDTLGKAITTIYAPSNTGRHVVRIKEA